MSVKDALLGLAFWRVKGRPAEPPAEPAYEPEWLVASQAVASRPPRPATEAKWPRSPRGFWLLARDAGVEWYEDHAPRLGAALSYYTIFALAPVLLVAISVAGLAFGEEAARGQILEELRSMFGDETAVMVQQMLAKSSHRSSGLLGTVIGIGTLLIGATALLVELEAALDEVWKVKPKPGRGVLGALKDRLLSLGLILSLGFLLIVSLVASALLSVLGETLERYSFPGAGLAGQVLNNGVTFLVIAAAFALMFKYLPNIRIAWRDAWFGGLVTSALFHVGKIGIGIYLGRATVSSTFGAAGSLAVLLVWIYYSAQMVLYGAEITRLYAERYGRGNAPDSDAVAAPRGAFDAGSWSGQPAR
jgi:membrane protein